MICSFPAKNQYSGPVSHKSMLGTIKEDAMSSKTMLLILVILLVSGFAQAQSQPSRRKPLIAMVSIGYSPAIGNVDGDRNPDILLADKP